MTVSRLQVLEEARKIAETLGAVANGNYYFETKNGEVHEVDPHELLSGEVAPDRICGVCIAGACLLAEVLLKVDDPDVCRWHEEAEAAGASVLDALDTDEEDHGYFSYYGVITSQITKRGTPYVLAVLDRMVEREHAREAVGA